MSTFSTEISPGILHEYASSYQWDELVEYCFHQQQQQKPRLRRQQRERWNVFNELQSPRKMNVDPNAPHYVRDRWRNTPLHIACYHQPPPEVIYALLYATPSHRVVSTWRSRDGSTPLLIACATGTLSNDAIWMLLDAASSSSSHAMSLTKSNKGGDNENHENRKIAWTEARTAWGNGNDDNDDNFTTPLRELLKYFWHKWKNNNSNRRQRRLTTTAGKEQVSALKLHELGIDWKILNESLLGKTRWQKENGVAIDEDYDNGDDDESSDEALVRNFWIKTQLVLIKATARSQKEWREWSLTLPNNLQKLCWLLPNPQQPYNHEIAIDQLFGSSSSWNEYSSLPILRKFRMLHACVETPNCPLDLIYHASHIVHQDQVLERDEYGRTPLQIVLSTKGSWMSQGTQKESMCLAEKILCCVIRAGPRAVSMPILSPSNEGLRRQRTPFCHAIINGWSWTTGLKHLWDVEPRAIETRDPETGLYPFMSAATICTEGEEHETEHMVNTTYSLLRMFPQILMNCR